MADVDVNQLASMKSEYELSTLAIKEASAVTKQCLQLITDHAKSPAVAAQLMKAADGNQ